MSQIVDIVVRYRGVGQGGAGDLSEEDVLPSALMLRYNQESAQRAGRKLVRIGERTDKAPNPPVIDGTLNEMRASIKDKTLGQIFIFGSSSGSTNALDLARRLSQSQQLFIAYVGLLDQPFFPGDTLTVPNGDPPTNAPVFHTAQSFVTAVVRKNFFQLAGNASTLSLSGPKFTSDMKFKEIHGEVPFFVGRDMTNRVRDPVPASGAADQFHGRLIQFAEKEARQDIADLLDKLIPSGPSLNFIIPPLDPLAETVHIVAKGDNLSKLALRFYGNAALWPKIYEANRSTIGADPNLIRIGQRLSIPA